MNKLLAVVPLALFSCVAYSQSVISEEVVKNLISNELRSVQDDIREAQEELNQGDVSDSVEELFGVIRDLRKIVSKDSDQWKVLDDLEEELRSNSDIKGKFDDIKGKLEQVVSDIESDVPNISIVGK